MLNVFKSLDQEMKIVMSIQQSFQKTPIYFKPVWTTPLYAITEAARSTATPRRIAERCMAILG
ncbi:hypothetical protein B5E41_09470 [Rhizobium esperanzae]|uniref:Uncharacterized protein n=1 Tax=Rhizobium esperanzae TaxID=1967781 RepID=A0A246DY82_9HYPH|nr:hypothetical protein B5E41_09470 [Rhizobium esperanzae]